MDILQFFEAMKSRRPSREDLGSAIGQYIPPNLRPLAGFIAEGTPTAANERAGAAFSRAAAPNRTISQRVGDVGQGLSETASIAAPMLVANRAGVPAAEAVQDALLGTTIAAKEAGRTVADRANQRGPVPTMYSNPLTRLSGPMQMRGSDYFDAPNPNAGRSRDPAMFTPFSMTKSKNAPASWSAEGRTLGQNAIPELVTPEMQQGKRMFFAAGDRTAGDVEISSVGSTKLRRPVRLNAGAEYMDTGDTWASHKGVMTPKQNVLLPAAEAGEDIGLAFMPMGERSGDFAKHQGQLFSEMLFSSNMPRKSVAKVNEIIKGIADAQAAKDLTRENKARAKNGLKPLKRAKASKVPSVASEGFREWFDSQSAEGVRKPFLMAMDASPIKALEGVPDVGEARFAATNPNLVKSESYSTGFRFGTPDVERGLLPSDHPSYDTKLAAKAGTRSQTYGQDIPWTIAARDTALPRLAEAARDKGTFYQGQNMLFGGRRTTLPSDQRVFTMNPKTSQLQDQQYVDEASRYMELARTQGQPRAQEYEMSLIDAYLRGL